MNKGWLELESDPGLFTLLLQDFGVKGVQVEEIYDLQKPIEGPAYGFIFLFRWIEERRSRRKTITEDETFVQDDSIVNSIFFAQQMIPNSCASHALLSVLLNCEKVSLGATLATLKTYSRNMNPENKGYAIGNMPELAKAHNSHARQDPARLPEKQQGMTVRTMEAFHFVSYVPINGHLFELDGLKPYPIDHGPWNKHEDWTEKFRRVITERLGMATGGEPYHDIRFNLMAVVPDKCQLYEHKLSTLKTNRHIVLEALQQMVKVMSPSLTPKDKEKCIAAVHQRGGVVDVSPGARVTSSSSVKMELLPTTIDEGHMEVKTDADNQLDMYLSGHVVPKSEPMDVDSEKEFGNYSADGREVETARTGDQPNVVTVSTSSGAQDVGKVDGENGIDKVKDKNVQIQISVASSVDGTNVTVPTTVATTDVTLPLTIETKFTTSPGPSSASTDTASEVGSCFSSPSSSTVGTSAQNSPNVSATDKLAEDGSPSSKGMKDGQMSTHVKTKTKFNSQQGFKPKDLIALLKNVENEIKHCENSLRDEQEKINKYKIDDCRRTHNYDQFLCTFLSMLAEQGHLADLVQQHSYLKKRVPGTVGKVAKLHTDKKKKTKGKKKK